MGLITCFYPIRGKNRGNMEEIKLTSFCSYVGCSAKLPAEYLECIFEGKMLGEETLDDSAILKLDGETTLLNSIDYLTPMLDDPYMYGQVVAANALNDIYAMGGRPVSALNIVEFPIDLLDLDVLKTILKGGRDKAAEVNTEVIGGHTIRGEELKYGMSVIGRTDPRGIIRVSGARVGDVLVLTKPLGVGIIANAIKQGLVGDESSKKISSIMSQLNDKASEIMVELKANACTDITGFGLIGHASEMARSSGVGIEIEMEKVPRLDDAIRLLDKGVKTGGGVGNQEYYSKGVDLLNKSSKNTLDLFYDPQTSGGLLISLPAEKADELVSRLGGVQNGVSAVRRVCAEKKGRIRII
jgi:selenide,water dikinase